LEEDRMGEGGGAVRLTWVNRNVWHDCGDYAVDEREWSYGVYLKDLIMQIIDWWKEPLYWDALEVRYLSVRVYESRIHVAYRRSRVETALIAVYTGSFVASSSEINESLYHLRAYILYL
jgi:hypothetical protein